MWGTSWRQRLRLAPLYLAAVAADRLAAFAPARPSPADDGWRPGISVVVPERDAPRMLAGTLAALHDALDRIDEPRQVIVVANGAPRATYAELAARFPGVEWVHSDAPLAFAAAIERGLAAARHDGAYLLNNDMTLEPDALAEVLPLRAPGVFAIASQILQRSADGRREETGFTDWYVDRGGVRLYHAPVPATDGARPHLCASGGAALFRTAPLRRYVADSRCYDPFYWEDAEWGLRAWRDGLSVLYCPRSRATHAHRATTARFHSEDEIARIVERNRLLFDARHDASGFGVPWLMDRICGLPYASQRELATLRQAAGVFRHRRARARPPQPAAPAAAVATVGRGRHDRQLVVQLSPARAGCDAPRPRVLVVTPFAVFPPRHGGGRRVAELVRGLVPDFDIALVTDEASLYDARSFADFDGLCAIHLVQRTESAQAEPPAALGARMRTHCHPALVEAVVTAIAGIPAGHRRGRVRGTRGARPLSHARRTLGARPARRVRSGRLRRRGGRAGVRRLPARVRRAGRVLGRGRRAARASAHRLRSQRQPDRRARVRAVGRDPAALRRSVPVRGEPRGHPALSRRGVARRSAAACRPPRCASWAATSTRSTRAAPRRSRRPASRSRVTATTCRTSSARAR